jgi:hypothetical protein
LNHVLRMNDDDDFIRDLDCSLPLPGERTGWEDVVFELADEDDFAD